MDTALSIYRSYMSMAASGNAADWGNANPEMLKTIMMVRKMHQDDDAEEAKKQADKMADIIPDETL